MEQWQMVYAVVGVVLLIAVPGFAVVANVALMLAGLWIIVVVYFNFLF